MSNLSELDFIIDILSRLPVKSISKFKCVCKSWNNLFNDPLFIQMHLNLAKERKDFNLITDDRNLYYPIKVHRTMFDYLYVDFIGTTDGLFCIKDVPGNKICIWNPSTKQYKEIPSPPRIINPYRRGAYGFGYDNQKNDYKLVRIVPVIQKDIDKDLGSYRPDDGSGFFDVQVYTLRSNSWSRIVQQIPDNGYNEIDVAGLFANGSLYWMSDKEKFILGFNLSEERFDQLSLPYCYDENSSTTLSVLNGDLSVCHDLYKIYKVDVWVMKQAYGANVSWSKLITISQSKVLTEPIHFKRPLLCHNNGEILFDTVLYTKDYHGNALVTYDQNKERVTNVVQLVYGAIGFDTFVYVESLVSVHSDTYVEEPLEPVGKKLKTMNEYNNNNKRSWRPAIMI